MRKGLALLLTLMMLIAAAVPAMADDVKTVAGTPRNETLVVESLDGQVPNATQNNLYLTGTNVNNGLHQLVYANLWEVNTITGEVFGDLAEAAEALTRLLQLQDQDPRGNDRRTAWPSRLTTWSHITTLIEKRTPSLGARMATLVPRRRCGRLTFRTTGHARSEDRAAVRLVVWGTSSTHAQHYSEHDLSTICTRTRCPWGLHPHGPRSQRLLVPV
jgi:hypothetical protein